MTNSELAQYMDATLLKLDATREQIVALCEEAKEMDCYSVCVYPCHIGLVKEALSGSSVKIAVVVGFPSGRQSTAAKLGDIEYARDQGADEIDLVMNYFDVIDGYPEKALEELKTLCTACRQYGLVSKVIVETCYLNHAQKLEVLTLCETAHADFIKTSTGFGSAGAQLEDVQLWNQHRGYIKIKASGGIRNREQAEAFINAGANRLGLSSAKAVFADQVASGSAY